MLNDEWQTVARNIELVSGNWGGGTVGSAQGLSIGNSTSTSALAASVNDNQACTGITQTCDGRTWHTQRRTFTLNNGQVIWDMAGNVWEWMKDDNAHKYGTSVWMDGLGSAGAHRERHTLTLGATLLALRDAKAQFGPAGDYSALSTGPHGGLGQALIDTNAGTVRRGGAYGGKGLFSVDLSNNPTTHVRSNGGFRCVYHPPVEDISCQANAEEERSASNGRGREYRTCSTDGKSWSNWKFKSCAFGYALETDTHECYRQEQGCASGVELLATDGSGDYEHCGARPTVSLHAGKIQNLREENAKFFLLKGGCSVDGIHNIQVALESPSSFIKVPASCFSARWEVGLDLSAFVDKKEIFTVKVNLVDAQGRKSFFAESTFNTGCPDNYVYVFPPSGLHLSPFLCGQVRDEKCIRGSDIAG